MQNEELRKAQSQISESRDKYSNLYDFAPVGYFTLDKNGTILEVNLTGATLLGVERSRLINTPFILFVILEHQRTFLLYCSNLLKMSRPDRCEIKLKRKDGTQLWALLQGAVLKDTEGKVTRFRCALTDISERKRAEEETLKLKEELEQRVRQRTSELEVANQHLQDEMIERRQAEEDRKNLEVQIQRVEKMEALGTLAGGVAHDLNNILGSLVGYPGVILMQLPVESPLREPVLAIQRSAKRAAAVVQDLLTLTGRGMVSMEVIDLNGVVSDYMKTPEQEKLQSSHPHVEFEVSLEPDLLPIKGSYAHLSMALMNLLSNGAEAIPERGVVTISTKNQHLDRPVKGYDRVKGGDYVVLEVSDTGEGISAKDMRKIFEPFYTKKIMRRSGTGLGLSVVWGTVKDHNGYIDVWSGDGSGTRFTLYFPVTREALTQDQLPVSLSDHMGKGETILVVDDEKEQRELAIAMLIGLNYRVASVSSGEKAVEYLRTQKVDLLILDMIMDPGIDGLETYRRILEFHPGQKAIIVSGFSETERVKQALTLGAGPYIRKPFLLEKIGLAVRQELGD